MIKFRISQNYLEESAIICGDGALDEIDKSKGRTMVVTDTNVFALYQKTIEKYFKGEPVFQMPAGEENKNEQTLFALLSAMAEAGLTRGDRLICFGGGVVGDLGGLASALYMRGIACVQIPTTLLSQVDSSVGGKTAVDFQGVKNLVGVFSLPKQVLVEGAFLNTLPPREIRCGLGEIVKHAALNAPLFDELVSNKSALFDLEFLRSLVPENIAVKAEIVQKDVREAGLRKCLNLGHTAAHAFELFDGKLSHGEYVLIGILFEAELAKRRISCDKEYLSALQALCRTVLGTFPALPDAEQAAAFALLDKKNARAGAVTSVLPVKKGAYALLELPFEEYCRTLKELQKDLC